MKILGIDIGGTEVKCAFVENGRPIGEKFVAPARGRDGVEAVKNALAEIIDRAMKSEYSSGAVAAGVSCAGNIDYETGKVVGGTGYIPGWIGFEVAEFVAKKSGLKTFADNDAYCALYGETSYGASYGYSDVCMLTLGTGVGGAVALNGNVLHGKDFIAGRLGHIVLYPNGKKCDCGRRGCVEQYLSGRAFTAGARQFGFDVKHGSEVFAIAKDNPRADEYCRLFFAELRYVFQTLENAYNPELVIIGGGMANSYADWEKYIAPFKGEFSFKVLPAKLGNDAGIIGAAAYAEKRING